MKDLVIIGAGCFGEEMLDHICQINEEVPTWNVVGFIDDERTGIVDGVKILGNLDDFLKMDKSIQYFVASLDGKERERIMNICKAAGFTAAVIIGAQAIVEENVEIGEGSFVGYKTKLYYGCRLGSGVIVEYVGIISAETQIGAYTTIRLFPSVGRSVRIGKYNSLGARCTIDDRVVTADDCSFKVGSVVVENIDLPGMYAGLPAKLVAAKQ